jgi:class 3 adenylate cyclase
MGEAPGGNLDCQSCQTFNKDHRRYCRECGTALFAACTECGFENDAGDKYCGGCGVSLLGLFAKTPAPKPSAPPPTPSRQNWEKSAERRLLTVLFCDLAGSTELTGKMDPEDLREVEGAYQRGVAEAVTRCGGYVARYMGDGVLAYFGYPIATGDDAASACRAGLAAIESTSQLDRDLGEKFGVRLRARVGIATGQVVVGELIGEGEARERSVVGETPNLAARLEGVAEADTVVIAPSTKKLSGRAFEYEDLGLHPLKGFSEPVQAWRVVSEKGHGMRFDAKGTASGTFVGRQKELAQLKKAWLGAQKGEGQFVTVNGEAGFGKSRLLAEFAAEISTDGDVLTLQCSAHHRATPLFPFFQELRRQAGIDSSEDHDAWVKRLEPVIGEDEAELFARVLRKEEAEESAEERRIRIQDALLHWLLGSKSLRPQLVIIEDIQDADPTTQKLLGQLAEASAFERVLVTVSHRPTPSNEAALNLEKVPHHLAMKMEALSPGETLALIENAAGLPVPEKVAELIREKTDGVPLFVEELTHSLLDDGFLEKGDKTWRLVKPLTAQSVPGTLQASLIAKLDRLSGARRTVQMGAALGRAFSHQLLSRISNTPEEVLARDLENLVAQGILIRQGHGQKESYIFQQALFQEVAYGTLLRRDKEALHAQIAEAMAKAPHPDWPVLAEHRERATQQDLALDAWKKAADAARADAANREALAHLQRADALVKGRGEDVKARVPLLLDIAELCRLVSDLKLGLSTLDEIDSLTEDPACLARAEYIRGNLAFFAGESAACEEAHTRALALARKAGSREFEARALGGLGDAYFMQGRHSLTIKNVNDCLEICREEGLEDVEAANLAILAMPYFWALDFEAVERIHRRSMSLAKKLKAARAEGVAYIGATILARERMEAEKAELAAFQSHAIFGRLRSRPLQASALYWAMRARRLRPEKSLADLAEQAREMIAGANDGAFNPQIRVVLILAEEEKEGLEAVLNKAEEALEKIHNPTRAMWSYDDIIEVALLRGDFSRAARLAKDLLPKLPEKMPWADVLAELTQVLAAAEKEGASARPKLDAMDKKLSELGWSTKSWVFSQARQRIENSVESIGQTPGAQA